MPAEPKLVPMADLRHLVRADKQGLRLAMPVCLVLKIVKMPVEVHINILVLVLAMPAVQELLVMENIRDVIVLQDILGQERNVRGRLLVGVVR